MTYIKKIGEISIAFFAGVVMLLILGALVSLGFAANRLLVHALHFEIAQYLFIGLILWIIISTYFYER